MSNDTPRLIEHAFPLKQASLTSVHEKNVRHGHISTLHIWPARRPLAACRAALIATLLPDPGTPEKRKELCERIGGKVVERIELKKMPNGKTVERVKQKVEGGILSWIGTEPKSGSRKKKMEHRAVVEHREKELQWFRDKIRKTYGGRVPRILDPFAGGGAIPLEAMRLGCEVTAMDINPVAWFILKCTLEYPQKLSGKTHPLPDFILDDEAFMADFYRAYPHLVGRTKKTKKQLADEKSMLPGFIKPDSGRAPKADLAWHVRAWGRWVLNEARKDLAPYYPTYADFEPINLKDPKPYERQEMRLVAHMDDGTADIHALNAEFSQEYLADKRNPRWVAKPTVAYLWARTVICKNCRATVPLLKTRWLCRKKDGNRQRTLLTLVPNPDCSSVVFGIADGIPARGGNAAQRREHDKTIGAGTMSKSGVKCPCCSAIMTMDDIRVEARTEKCQFMPTVVAVDGQRSKEFRPYTDLELALPTLASTKLSAAFSELEDGDLFEATPLGGGRGASRAFSLHGYGLTQWKDLFLDRQRFALAKFASKTRAARQLTEVHGYPAQWNEAIAAYLACGVERLVDFANVNVQWKVDVPTLNHALVRFAIQITWDFAEGNPTCSLAGGYLMCLDRIVTGLQSLLQMPKDLVAPAVIRQSSKQGLPPVDLIITDPPYYDAIPYSDLMDWFYVWLRRVVGDLNSDYQEAMQDALGPKWDHENGDGELIDDDTRHGGDSNKSKDAYEDGMAAVFSSCNAALPSTGRLVVVFANKQPDAWETLVVAVIRSGFVVDGSWPIQTEQPSRTRGISSSALASSVWLVCKKRSAETRVGWDNRVLEDMRTNITDRLRDFWDAGIRGPDFVWAATGPALEAYSKHPVVKKANDPGQIMTVGEFLIHVRRMVVDFVVGQVLSGDQDGYIAAADRMDSPTAYYLLHRHDFGLDEAPAGACILYATACGISDRDLETTWDLISTKDSSNSTIDKNDNGDGSDDEDGDSDSGGPSSGGQMKLKTWLQRKGRNMGYDAPSGRPVPLIDRIHRLMHLWRAGDVHKVDEYLDDNGLRRHELFKRLVQSLIELSDRASEERSLLESLSNHIGGQGAIHGGKQDRLAEN